MGDGTKPDRPILAASFHFRGCEIVVKGMDELYLEEVCVAVCNGEIPYVDRVPTVILLETIRKSAESEGKYIRQTGGMGNYGHVRLNLEPNVAGEGFEFINEIKNGEVPPEYIAPVEQGIREAMQGGVLSGYEVVDVKATLLGGSFDHIDSNEMAFKIAGLLAFKEAAKQASPVLLEPMMTVEAAVLEVHAIGIIGAIMRDINSRRGRIEGIKRRGDSIVITATVPLRETLRSSRNGRLEYPMHFTRYEPVSNLHGEFGDDGAGVAVRNPRRPNTGSGFATAELKFDFE